MQLSQKTNQFSWWFIPLIISSLFLFLRVYKLPSSLLFFGDMGRDFLEMHEWYTTRIPPLLGPQTSALPLNQSAWYFYLLMPFYLISGHSLFSSIIAVIVIHLLVFAIGVVYLRRFPGLLSLLLTVSYFVTIHPQYVLQHRYVWNPSFVGLFLLSAFICFQLLKLQVTRTRLLIFSLSLAMSVSFSYSTAPAVMSLILLSFFTLKPKLRLAANLILSFILVNSGTIFFELRHGFLLTKMMLFREKLPQLESDFLIKSVRLANYLIPTNISLSLIILVLFGLGCFYLIQSSRHHKFSTMPGESLLLFLATLIFTLLSPFSLHAHYIFGVLIYAAILIALMPWVIRLGLVLILSYVFLSPKQLPSYFKPAFRTVSQTLACTERFCKSYKNPLYVSIQAGLHPYHDAKDFRYLFSRAGCQVRDINIDPQSASSMAVVSDDSVYTHGQTAYHELTLFGPSNEISRYYCDGRLIIHLLEK